MGEDSRRTDRLRLEPIRAADAQALWQLHRDRAVAIYWGAWSRDEARRRAATFEEDWRRDGVGKWLAFDHGGQLVGRGGLSRTELEGRRVLEVGWTLRRRFWGEGYATEIGDAGLRMAFDELGAEGVVAYTEVHNWRSRAVMQRLGMRYERELTMPGLVEGRDGIQPDAPFALYAVGREGAAVGPPPSVSG